MEDFNLQTHYSIPIGSIFKKKIIFTCPKRTNFIPPLGVSLYVGSHRSRLYARSMLGHPVRNSPVCYRFKEKENGGIEDDIKRESIKKGIPEGGSSGNGATFRQQDVRQPADIPVLSDANSLVFRAARQLCDNSMSRRLLLRAATAAWPPSSSTKAIYTSLVYRLFYNSLVYRLFRRCNVAFCSQNRKTFSNVSTDMYTGRILCHQRELNVKNRRKCCDSWIEINLREKVRTFISNSVVACSGE
ncbi:hypothetical protein WN51_03793 [Melipona quadrifasciata]|uniref:Uncharacterized protein n=1 Tax=Melipona quadrifasciata TaxID=166423 RepID=A0A0M8ZWH8_9HYME|nr:hypothetical protein WN51_03793 [Melipona quadrifasciata]